MSRGSHCMRCGLLCNVFERDGQRIYVCPGAHGQQHAEPIPEATSEPETSQAGDSLPDSEKLTANVASDSIAFGRLPGTMQEGLLQHLTEEEWNGMSAREQLTKLIDLIALHEHDSEDEGEPADASKHGADTGAAPGGDLRPGEVGTGTDPGQGETTADDSNLERVAGVSGSE